MSVAGSAIKQFLKEGAKETGLKTAKSVASEMLKEQVQAQFGTGIKRQVQESIKQAAKAGLRSVTVEQAREAAKTGFTYTAQAVEENKSFFRDVAKPFADKLDEKIKNKELTPEQATKSLGELASGLDESTVKRMVASTGASQTMLIPRNDEEILLLNELHRALPKIMAEQSTEGALAILRAAGESQKKLKEISGISVNLKKQGAAQNLWKYGRTITKSVMLLQNVGNRVLDAGGNILERGVSLANLATAEAFASGGRKLAKNLPQGVFRDILNSPGVYSGEISRSLQGSWIAMKDYLTTGSKNTLDFFKSNKGGIKETIIGKNARKIDYAFNWEREQELANIFLPTDVKTVFNYVTKHPLKAADKLAKGGFFASKLADEITGGAFREGDMLSSAYRIAMTKAEQLGKENDVGFINDMIDLAIKHDKGEPLPADKLSRMVNIFGESNFDTILDRISDMATESAAHDTYRLPSKTIVGKNLAAADQWLYNAPFGIGVVYDILAPLARLTYKITDIALENFPLGSPLYDIFHTFNIAKKQVLETGTTNVADLQKAVGRFVNGSIAYAIFGGMVASGILFGDRPKDKKEAALMDKLGVNANSINAYGLSVPFERLGSLGKQMGSLVNLVGRIREAKEDYYNPQKPYGLLSAELQILEEFVKTPVWGTSIGDLIEKTNLEGLTEDALINSFKTYERLYVNTKSIIGLEDGDVKQKVFANVGKEIDDYYIGARPKPGFFGKPMKDTLSVTQKDVLLEMNAVGCSVQEPEISNTAKVDGVDIVLEPIEKMLWQEMMQGFYMRDTPSSRPRWTSLEEELTKTIHDPLYEMLPTRPYKETVTGEFVKEEETKAGKLADVYNDCKKAALDELLSYKDKVVSNDTEKLYSDTATSLYNRAQKMKEYLAEKPVKPVIDVPTLKNFK